MSDTEFESFVMNAGPDILRFCRIITNNKEQGDELYQDAMVLLLEKRVSLKAEQNSKSYALSVAVLLWKKQKEKNMQTVCELRQSAAWKSIRKRFLHLRRIGTRHRNR